MNIGELAERTGLSRSRIRFYETKGLLNQVSRSGNGYRSYQPDAVLVLKIVTSAQQAGFSLSDIAKLLPTGLGGWKHDELVTQLRQKVGDINDVISQLEMSKRNLEVLIDRIENKPEGMDCEANARDIFAAISKHGDLLDDPDDKLASNA
jgi:DNA-binding transcriptional MerR regulator